MIMGRLFWKVFLGFWLTLVLAGAGVGAVVLFYSQAQKEDSGARLARRSAAWGVSAVAVALRHGGLQSAVTLLEQAEAPLLHTVLIVDGAGRDALGRPVPPQVWERVRHILRERGGRKDGRDREDGSDPRKLAAAGVRSVRTPDGSRYVLFAAQPPLPPPPLVSWQLLLLAAALASVLFSGGLAWSLTRPLRHLRSASQKLAAGALETRVAGLMGRRRDEIADLGRDFDYMAGQLQTLVDSQRRLLHDVSHELRSPLARLQTAIGLMRQQPDKSPAMVDRIELEIQRLSTLR